LIHDDLPAMDDDVLRRGRPTCHVAFNEATAILAGDGLQALAFLILGQLGENAPFLMQMVARAVGPTGMVGGQQEDLEAEGQPVTAASVTRIHERKTARMVATSIGAGAWLAGVRPQVLARLQEGGKWLGLAFQGADDLLDVTGNAARLGKTAGKDQAAQKATWIRLEGVARARQRTDRYGKRALRLLASCLPSGPLTGRVMTLAEIMWQRDR
jgi:farnesyl diphosphate synthase